MHALPLSRVVLLYLLLLAGGGALLLAGGDLARLAPYDDPEAVARQALAGVAVGLLAVVASRAATTYFSWGRRLADEFRLIFAGMSGSRTLLIAVLSGVSEEVVFRGVLQPVVGLWITTLVFGALHVGPSRHFLPWTLMALAGGLTLGLLAEWSGALLAPIVAHVVLNFVNLRVLARVEAPIAVV